MGVDEDRRRTAPARRAQIINALSREFNVADPSSAVARLRRIIREGPPRHLIISGDIDGVVSAMMLAHVTDWKVAGMVLGSRDLLLHPSLGGTMLPLLEHPEEISVGTTGLFGVDVFSPLFSSVSNHPLRWGKKRLASVPECQGLTEAFDEAIDSIAEDRLFLNPSYWAGIEAAVDSATNPRSMQYRYPLGTAQLLLAALEAAQLSPKLFDRDYLPWMVANCDGGLETIRTYHFNAPMWWSALGAVVGPASISESLYQLAINQRPNEFRDVANALRSEEPKVASALKDNWNFRRESAEDIPTVVSWLSGISGWQDPFLDGTECLHEWTRATPWRGSVKMAGQPAAPPIVAGAHTPDAALHAHLLRASNALYVNFTHFAEGVYLGWMLPT